MDNSIDETGKTKLDKIIENIKHWYSFFAANNERGLELKVFLMGIQWDDKAVEYYRCHNKIPMTINKLYAFVSQLRGELLQMSPNLKINAVGYNPDDPDVSKRVELLEDITRSIAYNSKSNIAYSLAGKNQFEFGYAAIFVFTDYVSENSFEQ